MSSLGKDLVLFALSLASSSMWVHRGEVIWSHREKTVAARQEKRLPYRFRYFIVDLQNTRQKQLKVGRAYFVSQFNNTVHHGEGEWGGWLDCVHSQEK